MLKSDHEESVVEAERIYNELGSGGVDVLLDDRNERPGVKFADAELIGIPLRVTIGPRGLENSVAELNVRSNSQQSEIALNKVVEEVVRIVEESR